MRLSFRSNTAVWPTSCLLVVANIVVSAIVGVRLGWLWRNNVYLHVLSPISMPVSYRRRAVVLRQA